MGVPDRADGPDPREDPQWALVRAAAEAPVRTPPGLISRVLGSVGGIRGGRHGEPVELAQDGGTLRVGEQALVLLARTMATEIGADLGGVYVSAVAQRIDGLDVLLTVRYGVPAAEAAHSLRARLQAGLTDQFGAEAPAVSVHVTDIRQD